MATILVVDDNATNRELMTALVSYRGHRALEAADGRAALEIARRERPDLVISDVLMPGMDGYQLARELRGDPATARVPVVFQTAHYSTPEARELAAQCGVRRILTKPCEPEDFLAALDAALAEGAAPAREGIQFDRQHLEVVTAELTAKVDALTAEAARRLAAEEELRSSQEYYRLLFEANPFPMWLYEVSTLRFFDVNEAACRTYGYSREEFLAMTLRDIRPAEDIPLLEAAVRVPAATVPAEWRHVRKDGSIIYVEVASHAMPARPGTRFVCAIDVTERVRAEHAVRESEERFRQLAENIHEIFFLTDLKYSRMLYVSPAYERIMGLTCESLYADPMSWMKIVHPEDLAIVQSGIASRVQSGEFSYEYRIVRPDGEARWIKARGFPIRDAQGCPYRVAGIAEDITDRVRLHDALAEREAALARAQRLARLGHIVSAEDGSFESWSESVPELLGRTNEGMPRDTRSWLSIVIPEDRERFRANAIDTARRRARSELQYRLLRPDASVIYVRQVIEPLAGPAGAAPRWFSTLQDVTEQKQAEDHIRRLAEELEHRVASRTAELQDANKELESFSYSVSHDLRAPLRAIEGFGAILEQDHAPSLPEDARELVERMRRNATRMSRLIDDLLALARTSRQALQFRPTDLGALVARCLETLDEQIRGSKAMLCVGMLPTWNVDASLMTQVFENLISNALKYSRKANAPRIEIGADRGPEGETVWIRDNGVGFDMAYADKLFGVFQRLHSQVEFEGTGVGLAIVHRILARHGGRIWAEAQPGRGATFYFTLGTGN